MAVLLRRPGRAVPVLLPLAAVVATAVAVLLTAGRPGGDQPASSLIRCFEMRTDAVLGYAMLVPSGWESLNLGGSRGYLPPAARRPPTA